MMELWVIFEVMGSGIFFFFFFEGRVNSGYDDKHRIEMIWRKRK